MNNLSIFVYLIQIFENISAVLSTMAICLLAVGVVAVIVFGIAVADDASDEVVEFFGKLCKIWLKIIIPVSICWAIIPTKETMLLIAASEVGEKIVTSEKITSVVDPSVTLLKTWIEKQTQDIQNSMTHSSK